MHGKIGESFDGGSAVLKIGGWWFGADESCKWIERLFAVLANSNYFVDRVDLNFNGGDFHNGINKIMETIQLVCYWESDEMLLILFSSIDISREELLGPCVKVKKQCRRQTRLFSVASSRFECVGYWCHPFYQTRWPKCLIIYPFLPVNVGFYTHKLTLCVWMHLWEKPFCFPSFCAFNLFKYNRAIIFHHLHSALCRPNSQRCLRIKMK